MNGNWDGLKRIRLWLAPGMGVKRHLLLAISGGILLVLGAVGWGLWAFDADRAQLAGPIESALRSGPWSRFGGWATTGVALLGLGLVVVAVGRLNRSLLSNWLPHPDDAVRLLHRKVALAKGPRVVGIGGGSGLSNLLRGLRKHTSNLTAVVAVSDDGGSSGRLRQAFDMPAPGDLTDCLAALSDNESELARLLQYRFARGRELDGHTFGNLLITTVTEVEGDFGNALRLMNRLLALSGSVYPATAEPVTLLVEKESGELVRGETSLRAVPGAVRALATEPAEPRGLPEVERAVLAADLIVLGPGSLFSSTIPPLLVPSVLAAVNRSAARLVYVCNIMTEAGETDGFDAFDHVAALERHGVRPPDIVLLNSAPVDRARVESYRGEAAEVVAPAAARFAAAGMVTLELPLLGGGPVAQHDSDKLAAVLADIAVASARSTSNEARAHARPGAAA
ncbi:MAG: uridine diphosphate-N-acetylglucosamine-binding protein YvcK [Trueperaceae bacterium]|nr:uridine diphosphate-N-acetylglucosamine-binding protein YvcK [Trueperaceae bacterium]